jgi:HK97 family phage portal protein
MGIITSKSNVRIDEATKSEMDAKFREKYAGAKKFGTPILTNGDLSFVPIGMSPADLKLVELGIIPLRAICNVYGVDSSLLNDPENKTYSNRKEAEKAMWDNAIIPMLKDIENALNTWLVPAYNKQDGKTYKIEFCLDDVKALQVDLTEMANRVKMMIEAGVYTPNEGREIMGYDKLDIPEMDIPKQSQPKQNNISQ